ncbi:Hypothetical predicted protein [Paramuricea clavata]|uniref:Uncharacterized protein n=1 Tax=Paramuricea clavata TaxID=317549 RepID=A0A6S7IQL4_PARCT|nr:Hypothetical predicted protein [Paramuricea clavata]
MAQLENCILLELWETVLERFPKTFMQLQSADLDLDEAVAHLESLMNYTTTLTDSFHDFEEKKQLKDGADNLVQQYPYDLETSLAEELVHFREHFKGKNLPRKEDALDDSDEAVSVELQMYRIHAKREIDEVFPTSILPCEFI